MKNRKEELHKIKVADWNNSLNHFDEASIYFDCLEEISMELISACPEKFEETENKIFQKFGQKINADKVFLKKYDFKDQTLFDVAGWCFLNNESSTKRKRKLPISNYQFWVEKHKYKKPVMVDDASAFPNYTVKTILRENSVKSHLSIPVYYDQLLWGFIGVDWKREQHEISKIEIQFTEKFKNLITSFLKKKDRENKIEQQRKAIEIVNYQKTAYLASINHELRTPLNAIIGFSQILEKQLNDETLKNYCNIIIQNGNDILAIMENILNLALADRNSPGTVTEKIFLRDFLDEIETITNWLISNTGKKDTIHFKILTNEKLKKGIILPDKVKIKQVLVNLIKNSIKFTEEGSITIGFRDLKMSKIEIFIQDTGIGISKSHQKDIWNFFDQGGNTNTKKHDGFGLGLAISEKIVISMNGSLSVSSTPGRGSKFSLTIPCEYTID